MHRRGVDVTLCKGGGQACAPYERVIPCWRRGSIAARRIARTLPRRLSWRAGLGSEYGVEQASFAWNLIRFLRAERIDLLHVQDPRLALIVQRARKLRLVHSRTILAHGTEEPASFLRKIEYLQHLAPWHGQECRAAGIWRPRWTELPNFIDCDRFCPGDAGSMRDEMGIPRDALVVLTAAAIKRRHKRVDALIEAFAGLRAAEPALPVWLVIAGGHEADTDELVTLGRGVLGDRVRFLVRFPRERMPELYRSANLFVLSSLKEMMPMALLEAAASGLPCIVNRHPVLEWMIGPGGAAIDMAAPGALTAALRGLLTDGARRGEMGRSIREHCQSRFGEPVVISNILDYYKAVLAMSPRAQLGLQDHANRPRKRRRTRSVSVVIPSFNSGAWVAQAVQSALMQSSPPSEVIVVDDGSTDDTHQRLAPLMHRIRYLVQPNQGVAVARNHGIAASSGELVAFLDADDVWHPRKLELQLAALDGDASVCMLGTGAYDWPGSTPRDRGACRSIPVPWRQLAVKNLFTTSSILVQREALERAGPFDPELRGPEDYDLWLRIAELGPVAILDAPLTGYRTVQGSLGQRAKSMEEGLWRILAKLDERGAWGGDRFLRRRARGYCGYSCAYLHAAEGNPRAALPRLLASLAAYPLPYRRTEVRFPFGRIRMLTMILRRLAGTPANPRTA